jgi:hypothetical protein
MAQQGSPQARPPIRVLTTGGITFLTGLTATEATTVGRHWNAVRIYLEYGDDRKLTQFINVRVAGHLLETDPLVIEWRAIRGDVRFESIYDEVV